MISFEVVSIKRVICAACEQVTNEISNTCFYKPGSDNAISRIR